MTDQQLREAQERRHERYCPLFYTDYEPDSVCNCPQGTVLLTLATIREQAAEIQRLREALEALEALVNRLDVVHADPRYQSVWQLFMIHGGVYTEPTYTNELQNARAALSTGAATPDAPKDWRVVGWIKGYQDDVTSRKFTDEHDARTWAAAWVTRQDDNYRIECRTPAGPWIAAPAAEAKE